MLREESFSAPITHHGPLGASAREHPAQLPPYPLPAGGQSPALPSTGLGISKAKPTGGDAGESGPPPAGWTPSERSAVLFEGVGPRTQVLAGGLPSALFPDLTCLLGESVIMEASKATCSLFGFAYVFGFCFPSPSIFLGTSLEGLSVSVPG